jgi:hypothetical protein
MESLIPKIIFIVPYRDREEQYKKFDEKMKTILKLYKIEDSKILYIHQCDKRSFNRGAMKNIGFLFVKKMYPEYYQDITLVFNDLDTTPSLSNNFELKYETSDNVIKHFFGYTYALGGIVSIMAKDFERINGFPNFWTWGYEDNSLQQRAERNKLAINRDQFFGTKVKHIDHDLDNGIKTINRHEFEKYCKRTNDGIRTIRDLEMNYDEETGFVNVTNFKLPHSHIKERDEKYDLRNGLSPYVKYRKNAPTMKMVGF